MNVINFSQPITGSFLVDVILWLVTATGSVAVGIILFTVLLKVITLPFDIMSRRSMRKNSLLMESMRPDLERLQRQYANNKDLYNQKMMALYKKNGYSMWGSCLPTLITLIIFIVAINGFTGYSQYQNRVYFYEMTKSYNNVIYSGFEEDGKYITFNDEGKLIIDDETLYLSLGESEKITLPSHVIYSVQKHAESGMTIYTENGFIKYNVLFDSYTGEIVSEKYELIADKLFTDKNFENSSNEIFAGFEIDGTYIKLDKTAKKLVFDNLALYNEAKSGENGTKTFTAGDHTVTATVSGRTLTVYTENGYVRYQTVFTINADQTITFGDVNYSLIEEKLFNEKAYAKENSKTYFGMETDDTYIKINSESKKFEIDKEALKSGTEKSLTENGVQIFYAKTDRGYTVYTSKGYMQYFREVTNGEELSFNSVTYLVRGDKLVGDEAFANENNNFLKNSDGKNYAEALESAVNDGQALSPEEFLIDIQAIESAEAFRSEIEPFLWVKNIWVTDGAHKHPVLDYEEFKTTVADTSGCGCSCSSETTVPVSEEEYNLLTANLTKEKNMPNGFYILCILSALISLGSQIIMNKSQKAQLELQTVDGQGAANQKMMTWMMPMMMAVFSFMYTSAFSIYIIINTTLSILTTVVINKLVEKSFNKANSVSNVVRGRIYTKKEEIVSQNKGKKKEANKEEDKNAGKDFLSGLADGKQPTKKRKKK